MHFRHPLPIAPSSDAQAPARKPASRRVHGLLALAGQAFAFAFAAAPPAPAQTTGTEAFAEWVVTHTDRLAGGLVATTGNDPGQTNATSVSITGQHVAVHGQHDLAVDAAVETLANGNVRLRGRAEHLFALTGSSPTSDAWSQVDGRMKARARIADQLTLVGIGGVPDKVELYFQLAGTADANVDLLPGQMVFYSFQSPVRLIATAQAPQSGGGTQTSTVSWGGALSQDLADTKTIDKQVVVSFDIDDPQEPLSFEVALEVEPTTDLTNGLDGPGATDVSGVHRASLNDVGAELVGIVIRDAQGNVLGDSTASGVTGIVYTVLDEIPAPRLPEWTIRSPQAIAGSDLADASASLPKSKMIDRSGLVKSFTSGITSYDDYVSTLPVPNHVTTTGNQWVSATDFSLPLQGTVEFDLGGSFLIDELALWQVSLKDVTILVSESPTGPWTSVGQYLLPSHTAWFGSYPIDRIDLGAEHQARYVRLQINDCHKVSFSNTFASANVGEIALRTKVVPEPGLSAMLALGSLGLAASARVRRQVGGRGRDAAAQG